MRKVLACIFFVRRAACGADPHFEGGAPVGATGPSFEASAGFVYLSMDMPSERVTLTGLDTSGLIRFATRWGVTADATYASTGNVLSTGHSGNFFGVLAGPVFYPVSFRRLGIFVHALAGVGRVDSAVPVTETKTPWWMGHSSLVCDRRRSRAVAVWAICRPHSGGLSADVVCRLNRFDTGPE